MMGARVREGERGDLIYACILATRLMVMGKKFAFSGFNDGRL